jgi:rhodanese-related sulfurtransferase
MKYLMLLPFLLLLACGQGQSVDSPENSAPVPIAIGTQKPAYGNVDVAGAAELMREENVVLLDVRTPGEIAKGKIEGAIEIDYRDPDIATKLQSLDREPTYLVYCAAGGRSSRTCQLMAEVGFQRLYNLEGGYTAWSKQN